MKADIIIIISLIFLLSYSCKTEQKYQTDANGLEYHFIEQNKEREKAKIGDLIQVRFKIYHKDSLLEDSKTFWDKVDMQIQKPKFKGSNIESALTMMSAGDSAHFLIDAHKFYRYNKKEPLPDFIKIGDKLRFEIRLLKIYTKEEVRQKEIEHEKKQLETEHKILKEYLLSENINTEASASGLYLIPLKTGKGKGIKPGQTAVVHYTGMFPDGRIFDSSVKRGKPFEFKYGTGQVIKAWDEAVGKMHIGDKIKIIAPSHLAYGASGYPPLIPPYSTLIFEIELLNIK